jgi:beta-galactosidase GanA
MHEEDEGQFDFSGDRDFVAFVQLAQEVGLYVIARPGPYICAEWDFGGLPAWLLAKPGMKIRTFNEPYIKAVDAYMETELLPRIEPLLYANGGPVILVQVENEFGSFGDVQKDKQQLKYIEHLVNLCNRVFKQEQSGEKVVLFTTDGGNTDMLGKGSLKGASVYTAGDGDPSDGRAIEAATRGMNPAGMNPVLNSEDYTGS